MIKTFEISDTTYLGAKVYDLGLGDYELKKGLYKIEVKRSRKVRSIPQNKLYWGYILPAISEKTGYEVDELHEYFKSLMETKEVTLSNTTREVPVSTKKMDTKQFTEYIEKIRQWVFHNLQIAIPTSDEITIDQIHEMSNNHSNRYY